jgi:hypothetical protein
MSELDDIVKKGLAVVGDPSMADDYRQTMLAAGIDPTLPPDAPDPGPTVEPVSLESLLTEAPTHDGVNKQTLPMRFIDYSVQDGGGKYAGYKSFMLIDVWHPTQGRILVTHSFERADGNLTPLGKWVRDRMKKGDVFQVGEVGTNRGFTVYRPITVG